MPSIKSLALCLAVVLVLSSADAQAPTRNLRAQHQSDTPHVETAATSATNVNVVPGTVSTNVNITPGTSTTTVSGATQAAAAPRPATPVAAQPAAGGGLNFGSLLGGGNPLTGVATMAHVAHGALLGHTGTLPSSYMQGQGGGH